jgi:long-chain fatty acid transport protein
MSKSASFGRKGKLNALAVGALFIVSQQAMASAFSLKEQSVTYLGNAFSGTASSAIDASTGFYNPAGLVELKNSQVVLAATYIKGHIKLYNASARSFFGVLANGNNPTKPKSSAVVPGFHAAWRINNCYAVSFNVSAPFGLNTKYSGSDIARYMATESKLATINYSPAIGYRINKHFDIGAGFDAVHVNAKLGANTNFAPFLPVEGYVNNKAKGWAYGYHLGVLYKPSDITKMGLSYFSKLTPHVKGDVTSANLLPALGVAPTSLSAHVDLPDRVVYSVTHQYDDKWTAMGDIEWTHWSRFENLRLNYNTGRNSIEYFNFKNAWRVALGTDYKFNKDLIVKGGLAFEQSPTNKNHRSARLPDSDRYWVAFGLKYVIYKNLTIDGAYAHVFFKNISFAQTALSKRALYGNYRSSADLVGIQLTWNFV